MLDVEKFVSGLHEYIARALAPLAEKVNKLYERAPERGEKGDRGEDGKSITVEDISPVVKLAVSDAIALIPIAKDGLPGPSGKDGRNAYEVAVSLGFEGSVHDWMQSLSGPKGDPGESIKGDKGDPGESIKGEPGTDGKSVSVEDVRPIIYEAVRSIPTPKDGLDGKSVTVDEVLPVIREWFDRYTKEDLRSLFDAIPIPKDGVDGRDGQDGKSVTVEDFRQLFETEQAKWALEFERRAHDSLQRAIDRMPVPKDGLNGKDGRDAFQLEDVEVELSEDGRNLTLAFVREGARVERSVVLPHVIYRGVYKQGDAYQLGDSVTYSGSTWIAMRDTDSKPEIDDSWRLSVKRGRDGKDGMPGARGPEGPKGRDGRDLTQLSADGSRY